MASRVNKEKVETAIAEETGQQYVVITGSVLHLYFRYEDATVQIPASYLHQIIKEKIDSSKDKLVVKF